LALPGIEANVLAFVSSLSPQVWPQLGHKAEILASVFSLQCWPEA